MATAPWATASRRLSRMKGKHEIYFVNGRIRDPSVHGATMLRLGCCLWRVLGWGGKKWVIFFLFIENGVCLCVTMCLRSMLQ